VKTVVFRKKRIVEQCLQLGITRIKADLIPGFKGELNLSPDPQNSAGIRYSISGKQQPETIRLTYPMLNGSGVRHEMDYPVSLLSTPLPWGEPDTGLHVRLKKTRGCAAGRSQFCIYRQVNWFLAAGIAMISPTGPARRPTVIKRIRRSALWSNQV